jgi:DNA-binding transcriptional MocR family regulator
MTGDRHMTGRVLAKHLGSWRAEASGVAYAELAERIKLLVLDGRLPVHTRLPAERELAGALKVSRTTVAAGYDLLRAAGFVQSRRGAGSWTTLPDAPASRQVTPFAPSTDPTALDLAYSALAAPPDALASALRAATELAACHAVGNGYQLLGLDSLRDTVAARFSQRGLPTTRDQILITCGAQQAIAVVLAAWVAPGERVLVEHPTYPNALDAIAREHARAVPVGFTGDGWDLATMAAAVRDACPRLIYLIPDYQNPTGLHMNQQQRAEVVSLARRTGTPLLIDETMSEIVLDGPTAPPLATHASGGSSPPLITIGSASKTFWGGLRIGWVRAAPAVIEQVARARASMDISTSVFDQLITQHLMGTIDEVLAHRLPALRSARDRLLSLVAERFPGWRTSTPPGGLSLWADLGRPVSSALVSTATRHHVLLAAGPRFGLDGAFERCLRLPYTLPEPTLELAVERLAAAWTALPEAGLPTTGWPTAPAAVA